MITLRWARHVCRRWVEQARQRILGNALRWGGHAWRQWPAPCVKDSRNRVASVRPWSRDLLLDGLRVADRWIRGGSLAHGDNVLTF